MRLRVQDVFEMADGRERRTAFRAAAARLPVAQRREAERHAAAGEVVADSIQGQGRGSRRRRATFPRNRGRVRSTWCLLPA